LLYLDSVDMREWEKPAHPSKLKKKCNYETPYFAPLNEPLNIFKFFFYFNPEVAHM
jgi:hypothetical protein